MNKAIFLSPHLDDAIYSCGATIYHLSTAGIATQILSIFAGEPPHSGLSDYAKEHHDRFLASQTTDYSISELRIKEDRLAAAIVRATPQYLSYLDCIYRNDAQGNPMYTNNEQLMGDVHKDDDHLVAELTTVIEELAEADQRIYAPLAIGNHVDHQIVHRAAMQSSVADEIYFYEDYPYVVTTPFEPQDSLERIELPIAGAELEKRIEGVAAYTSQISTFWESPEELNHELKQLWESNSRADQYWKVSSSD